MVRFVESTFSRGLWQIGNGVEMLRERETRWDGLHSRLPAPESFPSNSAGKSKIATKLNAGIAESAPRAGLPSYLWQQGLGAGAIDAATDGRGLRGALETRRGGRAEAQPLSLPRSVCLQGFISVLQTWLPAPIPHVGSRW